MAEEPHQLKETRVEDGGVVQAGDPSSPPTRPRSPPTLSPFAATIQDCYDNLLLKPIRRGKPRRDKTPSGDGNLHSLSRTTVRHIANLLHLALKDTVKRGLIARNPVNQTEPPSRETNTPMTLTPEQLRMFLEDAQATAPIYLYALYVTKSMTGMRFGELLGARETDLDLKHGVVIVEQTLKHPGPRAAFGKPKTLRSRRAVTLPVEVVDALRQLRRWKIEQKL